MTSLDKLKRAYLISARVVAEFGDIYLPIFERLHQELSEAENQSDLKSIALKIAKNEATNF